MSDKIFIDTNIFIYAFDDDFPHKKTIANSIVELFTSNPDYYISTQVLREFYSIVTRKIKVNAKIAKSFIVSLKEFNIVADTLDTILKAIDLQSKYSLSFWDSLIVASAIENNCTILYSEDMQHNLKIQDLTVINPFKEEIKI